MRRHYVHPTATGFPRTSPTTRLFTMVAFGVLLFMMIRWAHDPEHWERLFPRKVQEPATVASELNAQHAQATANAKKTPPVVAAVAPADSGSSPKSSPDAAAPASPSSDDSKSKPEDEAGNPPDTVAPAPPSSPATAPPPAAAKTSEPISDRDKLPPEVQPTGPQVTGLTDEDPSEAAGFFKKNALALTDGKPKFQREEMRAYRQVVGWVQAQPVEILQRRVKDHPKQINPRYNWFASYPDEHRGKLFSMEVNFRRSELFEMKDADDQPFPLVEAWGTTPESRRWPCDFLIVDAPKDFPIDTTIKEKGTFYGYFLKLQGYQPADAKPGDAPLEAPLFIGRIVWHPLPSEPDTSGMNWFLGALAVGAVGVFFLIRLGVAFSGRRRPTFAPANLYPRSKTPESEVKEWLDTSFSGDGGERPEDGNNSPWESDNEVETDESP